MHRSVILRISFFLASSLLPAPSRQAPELRENDNVKRSYGVAGVDRSFDYVIVGGGTAGLTIASRLAEDPSLTVAVIEAGGFYEESGNTSVVPGYDGAYAGTDPQDTNPSVDWGFVTVPQKGANNRRMHYAQGRTLGGSSARNFMYYHRQTTGSADKWATETGDQSYTFENLLPFYQKSVHYNPPKPQYTNTTNDQDVSFSASNGGPLQVSFGGYVDPFGTWVLPALRKFGQMAVKGFQSGILIGSAYVAMTIDPTKMTRSSSEASFLQSSFDQKSTLTVYKNTLAEKLVFRGNKIAGVAISSGAGAGPRGQRCLLSARREVIVSAGAFKSPQLLMVSGIGPRQTLKNLGIPVLKDLPGVGQNLWDQPYFGTSFRVNLPTASAAMNSPAAAAAAVQAYLTQTGPLTMGGVGVIGFEKLPASIRTTLSPATQEALNNNFPSDWPDLEWLPIGAYFGYQTNYMTADPRDGYNYATLATSLLTPLSRGTVSISSANMSDQPLIDPNWLTHPADKEVAIAAFKRQRAIWQSLSNLTIGEEAFPGPAVQSDQDILSFISKSVAPIWHPAATCKMGKATDEMAVVDERMRVYGVQGLRVVDASCFPFLPPGHPQATVYALAEKVASEILGGGRKRPAAVA